MHHAEYCNTKVKKPVEELTIKSRGGRGCIRRDQFIYFTFLCKEGLDVRVQNQE